MQRLDVKRGLKAVMGSDAGSIYEAMTRRGPFCRTLLWWVPLGRLSERERESRASTCQQQLLGKTPHHAPPTVDHDDGDDKLDDILLFIRLLVRALIAMPCFSGIIGLR